ncbi:32023_t:CDS:2, partial [Gigaspora margarita]
MWDVLYGHCITNYYKLNDASEIRQETMQIFEGKTPPINKEASQFLREFNEKMLIMTSNAISEDVKIVVTATIRTTIEIATLPIADSVKKIDE